MHGQIGRFDSFQSWEDTIMKKQSNVKGAFFSLLVLLFTAAGVVWIMPDSPLADVLQNGVEPMFVPQQGLDMIKIFEGFYKSAKEGREIAL